VLGSGPSLLAQELALAGAGRETVRDRLQEVFGPDDYSDELAAVFDGAPLNGAA
jgi:hypothetical protein